MFIKNTAFKVYATLNEDCSDNFQFSLRIKYASSGATLITERAPKIKFKAKHKQSRGCVLQIGRKPISMQVANFIRREDIFLFASHLSEFFHFHSTSCAIARNIYFVQDMRLYFERIAAIYFIQIYLSSNALSRPNG